jgi:hypothetical protein
MKATSPTVTVFGSLPAAILSTTMPRVMNPRNWPSSPHTASAATPSSRIRWPARRKVFPVPMPATSASAVSPMLVIATSRWSNRNRQPTPVPPRLALLRKVDHGSVSSIVPKVPYLHPPGQRRTRCASSSTRVVGCCFPPIRRLSVTRFRCLFGSGCGGAWLLGGYPGGEEQREEREERESRERGAQPVQAGLLVLIQDGLGDLLARACFRERRFEVSVGKERDPLPPIRCWPERSPAVGPPGSARSRAGTTRSGPRSGANPQGLCRSRPQDLSRCSAGRPPRGSGRRGPQRLSLPSWEARAPIPRPARSSGTVTISAPAFTSMLTNSHTIPPNIASSPAWTTSLGDTWGRSAGCRRRRSAA